MVWPGPFWTRNDAVAPGAYDGADGVMCGPGSGDVTTSVMLFDKPPPGAGLKTVSVCEPGAARSAVVRDMVTDVAAWNVVGRATPSKRAIFYQA